MSQIRYVHLLLYDPNCKKRVKQPTNMLVEDFAIDSKNVRREGDVLVSTSVVL